MQIRNLNCNYNINLLNNYKNSRNSETQTNGPKTQFLNNPITNDSVSFGCGNAKILKRLGLSDTVTKFIEKEFKGIKIHPEGSNVSPDNIKFSYGFIDTKHLANDGFIDIGKIKDNQLIIYRIKKDSPFSEVVIDNTTLGYKTTHYLGTNANIKYEIGSGESGFNMFLKPDGSVDYYRTNTGIQITRDKNTVNAKIMGSLDPKDPAPDVYMSLTTNKLPSDDGYSVQGKLYNEKNYRVAEGEFLGVKKKNKRGQEQFIIRPFADSDSVDKTKIVAIKNDGNYYIYHDISRIGKKDPDIVYEPKRDKMFCRAYDDRDVVNESSRNLLREMLRSFSLSTCEHVDKKYSEIWKKFSDNFDSVISAIDDTINKKLDKIPELKSNKIVLFV